MPLNTIINSVHKLNAKYQAQYQTLQVVVLECLCGFYFSKNLHDSSNSLVLRRSQIVFKGGTLLPLFLGT